jgi:putative protease
MELEVFVHGALCMAYSGRCLLSGYLNKRDANQGTCTNACRWKVRQQEATENHRRDRPELPARADPGHRRAHRSGVPAAGSQSPDELMPAFEDEHGTYIMNAKDLRAVQHVERLTRWACTR